MRRIHGLASVTIGMLILGTILLILGIVISVVRKSVDPLWESLIGVGVFYFVAFAFWNISIIKYNDEQIFIRAFPWTKPSIIKKDNILQVKWKVEARSKVEVEIILKKHDEAGYNRYELSLNSQRKLAKLFLSHPHLIKSLLK